MPSENTETPQLAGVINLYKPPGRSSAHFVYRLRPILGVRRVGHAGTLDPFAEGVLLACVGRATKLVESLMNLPKRYRGVIRLDVTNETFDTERPFEPVAVASTPDRSDIDQAAASFVGTVQQVPPVFSAMRVGGVSSYKLAKRGKRPALAARPVCIYALDVLSYEWPRVELRIRCGRGTYIRAIARDLGLRLGAGGVCETLVREAVGPFEAADALRLEGAAPPQVRDALLPPDAVKAMIAGT